MPPLRGGGNGRSTGISSGDVKHGISPTSKPKQGRLGPLVNTQVELQGVETAALLDTGFPTSIASLEFLVEAKLKQKLKDQSHEEWEESFNQTIESPGVTLQSYGGSHVFTVGQTEIAIKRGPYSQKTTMQVQKNAPVSLLNLTNLKPML